MMAGIYISGLQMPNKCIRCPFAVFGRCVANNFKYIAKVVADAERDPDCPLTPVPDHGKLIDADALADRLEKDRTFILHAMMEAHKKSEGYTREDYLFDRNGDFISILRNQAAIIPADKKEEK